MGSDKGCKTTSDEYRVVINDAHRGGRLPTQALQHGARHEAEFPLPSHTVPSAPKHWLGTARIVES